MIVFYPVPVLLVVALSLLLSAATTVLSDHDRIIFVPNTWTPSPVDVALSPELEARIQSQAADLPIEQKARLLDLYMGVEFLTDGAVDVAKVSAIAGTIGIGQIHDLYPPTAAMTNTIQSLVLNVSGAVPVLFIEEGLHGYAEGGHTVFPSPLNLAASFQPPLLEQVAAVIGKEMRAYGVRMVLGPVLGAAREVRWGRTEETFGEDTYLISQLARAYVSGIQGRTINNNTVISEPKHYAAHSIPEGGRNTAVSHVGVREMEDTFLPQFHAAVEAGALGIMSAYSEADGIPCSASEYLLTEKLRKEFGFRGFVLSDLGAVNLLYSEHATAATPAEAVYQFLSAGGNSQFYDFDHDVFQGAIIDGVNNGTLSIDVVNSRVADMLRVRELLQLNTQPYTDPSLVSKNVRTREAAQLALKMAEQSMVLLKNNPVTVGDEQSPVLPLRPLFEKGQFKHLAVVGVLADEMVTADYAGPNNWLNAETERTTLASLLALVEQFDQSSLSFSAGVDVFEQPDFHYISRQHFTDGVTASFYTNVGLRGEPAVVRMEDEINESWYHYGFATDYASANFSARYNGTVVWPSTAPNGRLAVDAGDNGAVRLYLDGKLVIDQWKQTGQCKPCAVNYAFVAGESHSFVLEYWQNAAEQSLYFEWDLIGNDNGASIDRAINAVSAADIAVIVVGDNPHSSGEGHDRLNISLSGLQQQLIDTIAAQTNTPIVVVLHSGRAPAIADLVANPRVASIVEAFSPGQSGGLAIARVLFGDVNPAGRLPLSYAKSVGQLPMFYNGKPSSKPNGYVDGDQVPVFPFGYGLSYSSFTYSDLVVEPTEVRASDLVNVTFTITNTSPVDGEEVAQLYLQDLVSSTTTPVKQLRGFHRTMIGAGKRMSLTLQLNVTRDCALVDKSMKWVVEPGVFNVYVGPHSGLAALTGKFTVVATSQEQQSATDRQQKQREVNEKAERERLERVQQNAAVTNRQQQQARDKQIAIEVEALIA